MITPISLDHTDLLGETTEDIAYEKAGIIKPGGYLISAAQPLDAAQVLLDRAREVGVPFRFEGVEFGVESRSVAAALAPSAAPPSATRSDRPSPAAPSAPLRYTTSRRGYSPTADPPTPD